MAKAPKKPEDVKDEPGAEERFTRGVKKALETPPKPHGQLKEERRRLSGKGTKVMPDTIFVGKRCK
jgi:hypothetical protein